MESIPEEAPSSTVGGVGRDTLRCKKCNPWTQFFKVVSSSDDQELELHKCPVVASSKYLTRILLYSSRFVLPSDFPGGLSAFQATVGFCLGRGPEFDPSNVVVIRCAAEYLDMDREVGQAERYLTQVVLRQWTATMVVLRNCFESREITVIADSDDVAVVARCVDAAALMIKSEFERQSQGRTRAAAVVQLPFSVFSRIIAACKFHGLGDRATGELLVKYARRWLFGEKEDQELEQWPTSELAEGPMVIEPLVRLLPEKPGAVHVGFLFGLLRYAIFMDAGSKFVLEELQARITPQLHLATMDDVLSPFSWDEPELLVEELEIFREIVAGFMCLHQDDRLAAERVASLWDGYLAHIGSSSPVISAEDLVDLVETIPDSLRPSHDQLFEVVYLFLKAHPTIKPAERAAICGLLDFRKLSPQICTRAVETLRMPLKKMVRALVVQDIYTKPKPKPDGGHDQLVDDGYQEEEEKYALEEARAFQTALPRAQEIKAELEAAALKLRSLEKEMMVLREALAKEKGATKSSSNRGSQRGSKSSSGCSSSNGSNSSGSSGLGRRLRNALSTMRLCRGTSRAAATAPTKVNPAPIHLPSSVSYSHNPRRPVYRNRIEVDQDVEEQEEAEALLTGGCLS